MPCLQGLHLCSVCNISLLAFYKVPISSSTTCSSGPALVYHLVCRSGRPECRRAHYVGMASSSAPNKKGMGPKWSNNKSHHKMGHTLCRMSVHLITCHKGETARTLSPSPSCRHPQTLPGRWKLPGAIAYSPFTQQD
jgi:hypothetical protein